MRDRYHRPRHHGPLLVVCCLGIFVFGLLAFTERPEIPTTPIICCTRESRP